MQYFQGTITATDGSNIITGEGTKFLGNVFPGNELRVIGIDVPWTVAFVDSDTQLRLNANYAGVGGSGLEYSITRDYTSRKNFPIPNPGDRELVHLLGQAIRQIDSMIMASKADLSLDQVDNTSDANKPVSTAQQQALDLKADKTPTEQGLADRYTKAELAKAIGNINNPMLCLPLIHEDDAIRLKGDFKFLRESDATYVDRYGVLHLSKYYSGSVSGSDAFSFSDDSAAFGSLEGYIAYLTDGTNVAYRWVDSWTDKTVICKKPIGFNPTTYKLSAPRFEKDGLHLEGHGTNYLRNNTMQGAVVGAIDSGGALPIYWSRSGVIGGLSSEVVALGEEDGINYIDYRWYGTPAGNGDTGLYFEKYTALPVSVGDTYTASCFVTLAGGSTTNVRQFSIRVGERDASGGYLADGMTVFTPSAGSLAYARKEHTRTMQHASVAYARCHVVIGYTDGQPIDITLRIGLPQLEKSSMTSSVIKTYGTPVTRANEVVTIDRANVPKTNAPFTIAFDMVMAMHGLPSIAGNYRILDDGGVFAGFFAIYANIEHKLRLRHGSTRHDMLTVGQWDPFANNRFVFSFDGTNVNLYLNGVLKNTKAIDPTFVSANDWKIGNSTLTHCCIRHFRIFDHAMTAAEAALT